MERLSPGRLWVLWVVALVRMVELVLVLVFHSVSLVLLASVVQLHLASSVLQAWVVLVVLLPLWQLLAVWVVVLVLLAGLDQLLELVRVALLAEWPEPLAVQVWVVLEERQVQLTQVVEQYSASQLYGAAAPSLCSSCPAVSERTHHGKSEAASRKLFQKDRPPLEQPDEPAVPLSVAPPL